MKNSSVKCWWNRLQKSSIKNVPNVWPSKAGGSWWAETEWWVNNRDLIRIFEHKKKSYYSLETRTHLHSHMDLHIHLHNTHTHKHTLTPYPHTNTNTIYTTLTHTLSLYLSLSHTHTHNHTHTSFVSTTVNSRST